MSATSPTSHRRLQHRPPLPILDQDISPLTSPWWLGARPTSGVGYGTGVVGMGSYDSAVFSLFSSDP